MTAIAQDLRHAVRTLLAHPAYCLTALLTLGLGIGFSTAIFTVVDTVLLQPLPYRDAGRLLLLRERRLPQFPEFSVAPGHYLAWRDQATTFDGIAAWGGNFVNLDTGDRQPERVRADRTTANLFPLLGASPLLGRAIGDSDDRDGAPAVVVLSYGAWQRRFGGNPGIVGRVVTFDRRPVTIIGVMPKGFAFPSPDTEMWIPMAFSAEERTLRGSHYLSSVARIKPGVSLERVREDLNTVAAHVAAVDPASSKGWDVLAIPLQDYLVRNVKNGLLVLLGAVALVLLIACVNVANLLIARGAARQREFAIRAAVGASRARLVRQLLVEQLVLALAGTAVGVTLAAWLVQALLALMPDFLPRQAEIGLNGTVLAFALALAGGTPLIFGLLPAVHASRTDLRSVMAAGGRLGGAVAGRGVRHALVIIEMALAVMLLVGATLLIRSFGNLQAQSPGFSPDHVVAASVSIPASRYPEGAPREQFFGGLLDRVRSGPHVSAAGIAQAIPMLNDFVSSFTIEGRPPLAPTERPTVNFYAVSPDYFAAMRIPLLRGRGITPDDRANTPRIAVINQWMADHYFKGEDPIGRRINVSQGPSAIRQIVGVVGDVKQYGLGDRTTSQVYEPYLQHPYFSAYSIVVRTDTDPAAVVPSLRAAVHQLDPDVPLARVRVLDDVVSASIQPQRFSAVLIGLFGAAALLLAAIGVYGVLSYTVGLRTQEIAIRMAHGADRTRILSLVLRGTAYVTVVGVGAGLLGAWLLRQLMANLLFGISPADASTYAFAAAGLTAVALVASAVPAVRATRVDPLVALRSQ